MSTPQKSKHDRKCEAAREKLRRDMVQLLYPHVMRNGNPGQPARDAFERAGRSGFAPVAVQLAYESYLNLRADESRELLNGWVAPDEIGRDLTKLEVPAMKIMPGRECERFAHVSYAIQDANADQVCVTIPAGTNYAHAVESLMRALEIVRDYWRDLPGQSGERSICAIEFGNKKGGVPHSQTTGKVEPQNGESARQTAPAGL